MSGTLDHGYPSNGATKAALTKSAHVIPSYEGESSTKAVLFDAGYWTEYWLGTFHLVCVMSRSRARLSCYWSFGSKPVDLR